MGVITKLNDVLCGSIKKVDDITKSSIKYWDDNEFCPPTPTPTATPTPTPTPGGATPTPTPTCRPDCCPASVCYDRNDCRNSCECNDIRSVYLARTCEEDPCMMGYATGIFDDDTCTTAATAGYYSQGGECYYWNGSTLVYQGPC